MNRFQKIVLFGAALDILLVFLFPPYDMIGVGRGATMFDAFYPVFSAPSNRVINGDVLYMVVFGILINAALGWLLLTGSRTAPDEPRVDAQILVIAFGIFNLVVVLLFPPMEAFAFAQRITVGTFDGFYFAFGDKSRRSIFVPLLYMEVLFVLTNACAFWLAMSIAQRTLGPGPGARTMFAAADALREQAARKVHDIAPVTSPAKRGPDRRRGWDPAYKGPERRRIRDRRRAS